MKKFGFKIVSPERVVFEAEVKQATLPTHMGEVTVLPDHIPMVSNLAPGEITVTTTDGKEESLAVSGGFIEVHPNRLLILADTAEKAEELTEDKAEEAHKRAEKLLAAKGGIRDKEYAVLRVQMEREFARLKVARKFRKRGVGTNYNK